MSVKSGYNLVYDACEGEGGVMIEREEIPGSPEVLITFRFVGATWADRVNLVGDFNNWDTRSMPMKSGS